MPSGGPLQVKPNETIDRAQDLGTLNQPVEASGSIGNGPSGAADVSWYHFSLADSARVNLVLGSPAGDVPFASVLSLYNSDPEDYSDPYNLDGHRMLAQVEANPSDGSADYSQDLGPGDYFVAISGRGEPGLLAVVAGSGYEGATGSYELTIRASDLGLSADGPTVIPSDPADGAVMDSSPLAIRLEMSEALDPITILPSQTVVLFAGTSAMVGDGTASQPRACVAASADFSGNGGQLSSSSSRWRRSSRATTWSGSPAIGTQTPGRALADPTGVPATRRRR